MPSLASSQNDICWTTAEIPLILMKGHNLGLGRASDWLKINLLHLIRSNSQIWVVTRHHYGISAVFPQMSFHGETNGDIGIGCLLKLILSVVVES